MAIGYVLTIVKSDHTTEQHIRYGLTGSPTTDQPWQSFKQAEEFGRALVESQAWGTGVRAVKFYVHCQDVVAA